MFPTSLFWSGSTCPRWRFHLVPCSYVPWFWAIGFLHWIQSLRDKFLSHHFGADCEKIRSWVKVRRIVIATGYLTSRRPVWFDMQAEGGKPQGALRRELPWRTRRPASAPRVETPAAPIPASGRIDHCWPPPDPEPKLRQERLTFTWGTSHNGKLQALITH